LFILGSALGIIEQHNSPPLMVDVQLPPPPAAEAGPVGPR